VCVCVRAARGPVSGAAHFRFWSGLKALRVPPGRKPESRVTRSHSTVPRACTVLWADGIPSNLMSSVPKNGTSWDTFTVRASYCSLKIVGQSVRDFWGPFGTQYQGTSRLLLSLSLSVPMRMLTACNKYKMAPKSAENFLIFLSVN
jgi:hypothetical protein